MIRVGCTAAQHGTALLAYPPLPGQRATVGSPHIQWPSLNSAQLLYFVKFKLQFNFETEPTDTSTSSFLESDVSLEPQRDLQREYWNWSPLIHPSTSYKLLQDTVQYNTHNTQHSTWYIHQVHHQSYFSHRTLMSEFRRRDRRSQLWQCSLFLLEFAND